METNEILIMVVTIIGSVLIPLIGFMFLMRGYIKDSAVSAVGDIPVELAAIKSELKAYKEGQKDLIDVYKQIGSLRNPHPNKEVLLDKLKNDTITREEAIALQEILNVEREKAENENDFLKAVIIIGILALVAAAITK